MTSSEGDERMLVVVEDQGWGIEESKEQEEN